MEYNFFINKKDGLEYVNLENAHVIWPNFEGRPDKWNQKGGVRKFTIRIDDEEAAEEIRSHGWNVRRREENPGEPYYTWDIFVRYDIYPPVITVHHPNGNKAVLKEEKLKYLDQADIESWDMTIRPYNWENTSGKGVKAFVYLLHANLAEDPWAEKYGSPENFEYPTEDDEELMDIPF